MLELKRCAFLAFSASFNAFNRTMLELKRFYFHVNRGGGFPFNRTMLELKQEDKVKRVVPVCLLIEPCWN